MSGCRAVMRMAFVAASLVRASPAPAACPGDTDGDNDVDSTDLNIVLTAFGCTGGGCAGDVDGDDDTDSTDLNIVLTAFGVVCPAVASYEPGTKHDPPAWNPDAAGDGQQVYHFSGEFALTAVDLRIPGRGFDFVWARKYRSRFGPSSPIGHGWDHSYNIFIEASGPNRIVHDGNSRADTYEPQPDGTWQRAEFFRVLSLQPGGGYHLTFPDKMRWEFHPLNGSPHQGRISVIVDRNNNAMTFDYDGLGRLIAIHDTLDTPPTSPRVITIAYNADGRIEHVSDWTGRTVSYQYYGPSDPDGAEGDLRSATSPAVTPTMDYPVPPAHVFPAGKTTTYAYSTGFGDARLNHNLLRVTDALGQTFLINEYDATVNPADLNFDRLRRQTLGYPGETLTLTYAQAVPAPANNSAVIKAIVNDRVGNIGECFYDSLNRLVVQRRYTGRYPVGQFVTDPIQPMPIAKLRAADPDVYETRCEYNADALPTRVVFPNLNERTYAYDSLNVDRRMQGNLLARTCIAGPLGGDQASVTESFEHEPGFGGGGFVRRHVDFRGNQTLYTYDAAGNRLHATHRIPSIVEEWEYNAFGQVTAYVHPDNGAPGGHRRRDEYIYYTPADGYQNGYLRRAVADALFTAHSYEIAYNRAGMPVLVRDGFGRDTLFEVNQLAQVLRKRSREVATASGLVRYMVERFYDANNNLIRIDVENIADDGTVDPAHPVITTLLRYEILNRLIEIERVLDAVNSIREQLAYDGNRNVVVRRRPRAVSGADPFNLVEHLYDELNRQFRRVRASGAASPLQSTTQFDYDGNGNIAQVTEGLEAAQPRTTALQHDGMNRLVAVTDAMGNVSEFHYDENGNVVAVRVEGELIDVPGSGGNVRLFEATEQYDAMDRLTRVDAAHFDVPSQAVIGDGFSTMTVTWADISRPRSRTDDNGNATIWSYDTANRLQRVTDAAGNTAELAYDANSNVVSLVQTELSDMGNPPQAYTTSYAYDALDRLIQRTDPGNQTVTRAYDSRSNLVQITDARGNRTRRTVDALNREIVAARDMDGNAVFTDPADIVTVQEWDESSRLARRTDDNRNAVVYASDSLDRLTSVLYADGTQESCSYDQLDNLVQRLDANGTAVLAQFDRLGRAELVNVILGPGVIGTTFESYAFDGLSRLVRAQDDDSLITRQYDSLGNWRREMQAWSGAIARNVLATHDGNGNRLTCTYPSSRTVIASYDALNRASSISGSAVGGAVNFFYVGPARLERRGHPNGTHTEWFYDGDRRPMLISHRLTATSLPFKDLFSNWDANDNMAMSDDPIPVPDPRQYMYDAADRLVHSEAHGPPPPPEIVDYFLDGVGNRQFVNGLPFPESGPYTCNPALPDPADCQVNQYTQTAFDARTYDRNGNLRSAAGVAPLRTGQYDYRNQLAQFFDSATGQTTLHGYDCLGRRITSQTGAAQPTCFYYADGMEIEERVGNALAANHVHNPGPGSASVLRTIRGAQFHFLHEDTLGSIRAATGNAGAVAEQYRYADFGKPSFLNAAGNPIAASAIANPWLYRSMRWNTESGWFCDGAIHYDPLAGEAVQRADPATTDNPARMPAIFTAGIISDVGELSVQISAQELKFQTEGPIICEALFQRLAPRPPVLAVAWQDPPPPIAVEIELVQLHLVACTPFGPPSVLFQDPVITEFFRNRKVSDLPPRPARDPAIDEFFRNRKVGDLPESWWQGTPSTMTIRKTHCQGGKWSSVLFAPRVGFEFREASSTEMPPWVQDQDPHQMVPDPPWRFGFGDDPFMVVLPDSIALREDFGPGNPPMHAMNAWTSVAHSDNWFKRFFKWLFRTAVQEAGNQAIQEAAGVPLDAAGGVIEVHKAAHENLKESTNRLKDVGRLRRGEISGEDLKRK